MKLNTYSAVDIVVIVNTKFQKYKCATMLERHLDLVYKHANFQ